jgi:CRISPR-associated exonuclease Cas4
MLPLGLLLLFLALLLLWRSGRSRQAAGLPAGRVIYADTRSWGAVEEPLYDPALALTGKPDYLVQRGGQIIPVEVKSSSVREGPYDEHIFQLAAYCLLVQRVYDIRPPYGIIHYPKQTFAVDFSPELEGALLDLLAEMRKAERKGEQARSHESPARCLKCGYRQGCEQRL